MPPRSLHTTVARIAWLPAALLTVLALLGSLNLDPVGRASAASVTSNVTVTAAVNANVGIDTTTNCAAAAKTVAAISVSSVATTPNTAPYCRIDFGASNTDRVQLAVIEAGGASATAFFERAGSDATNNITDIGSCGALTAGTNAGGMNLAASSVGPTGNTTGWGCASGSYRGIPKTSVTACVGLGGALSTTAYSCNWMWGISMGTTPPLAGAYSGTVTFTASDY